MKHERVREIPDFYWQLDTVDRVVKYGSATPVSTRVNNILAAGCYGVDRGIRNALNLFQPTIREEDR